MNAFGLKLVAAIGVALMDATVAVCCGPLLWRVWGGVAWARVGLLLLAGGCSFTLADIWAATIHPGRRPLASEDQNALSYPGAETPMEPSDV